MRKRILVVDDEQEILDVLTQRLSTHGYDVSTATQGFRCLEIIKESSIDLIILDIVMPCILGTTVCGALKGQEETRHIPIIILSAKPKETIEWMGGVEKVDAYMTKPFKSEELLEKIDILLMREN